MRAKTDHIDTLRISYRHEEEKMLEFATAAARWFSLNGWGRSYTNGDIDPLLLALRWATDDSGVLVVRMDEGFQPVVFADMCPQRTARCSCGGRVSLKKLAADRLAEMN